MTNLIVRSMLAALLFAASCSGAAACTWAAFARGAAAVVARTMDWEADDGAVVRGYGRNMAEKAADTPNALEYVSRYASIRIHSFGPGIVAEAMNEKGLQGSILFLDGSELPPSRPGRKDVSPENFVAYAVARFATVDEVVASLDEINFIPFLLELPMADGTTLPGYAAENWPAHYAFADAAGDRAIIEFIGGEVKVYHGREHDALTNEPFYEIHTALDEIGYRPNGSISTIDRRARAKQYMRDMERRGVETPGRALVAMRGLLAGVTSGTEEPDPWDDTVYPTLWTLLADQKTGTYYLSRIQSWCAEVYDFSMFPPENPEAVALVAASCPYGDIALDESSM